MSGVFARSYLIGEVMPADEGAPSVEWTGPAHLDIDAAADQAREQAEEDAETESLIVYELVPRVRVRRRSEIMVDEIVVEEGS